MAERIDIFSQADRPSDLSRFTPKPRAGEGRPSLNDLQTRPGTGKFISREAITPPVKPAPNRYRTGRNLQFNARASQQTIDGFLAAQKRLNRPMAEVVERALQALERELEGQGS